MSSFKKLQKLWYKKLKDSGFVDIEYDEDHLLQYASSAFKSGQNNGLPLDQIKTDMEAKSEYFRYAYHFLHEYKFKSSLERFIWTKHCEGVGHRKITELAKKKGFKYSRYKVLESIQKIRALMFKANLKGQ